MPLTHKAKADLLRRLDDIIDPDAPDSVERIFRDYLRRLDTVPNSLCRCGKSDCEFCEKLRRDMEDAG